MKFFMNSDDVKHLHDYLVFDPQGEVKKEELDQARAHAHHFFPEQLEFKEKIPFLLIAEVALDCLPSHLLRHCRSPRFNEKRLNRKS